MSSLPVVFLQTPADERLPSFSPDGKWLTYASRESGSFQVYVRDIPGGNWQISSDGGNYPMWSRSGRELFFESMDNRIMGWEPTRKGLASRCRWKAYFPGQERAKFGGGLVRIQVADEAAPYRFRDLQELSGMSARTKRALYESAILKGAKPSDRWGTFDPVPRCAWLSIQIEQDGAWVEWVAPKEKEREAGA